MHQFPSSKMLQFNCITSVRKMTCSAVEANISLQANLPQQQTLSTANTSSSATLWLAQESTEIIATLMLRQIKIACRVEAAWQDRWTRFHSWNLSHAPAAQGLAEPLWRGTGGSFSTAPDYLTEEAICGPGLRKSMDIFQWMLCKVLV